MEDRDAIAEMIDRMGSAGYADRFITNDEDFYLAQRAKPFAR
ncbi:MAG: hypothetical protein Q7J07_02370 [Pelolinea sp.]|nr:hypothetical protein [Pelolinea sp.]